MSKIRTILIALAVSAMTFAVVADMNVVVTSEKCRPTVSANAIAASGEAVFERAVREELKAAASDAKKEYEKRYEELGKAHDNFMGRVTILVTILGIVATIVGFAIPIISYFKQRDWKREFQEEVQNTKRRLEELADFDLQFRRMQSKQSLSTMKFEWVEFLHIVQSGNAKNRDIVLPFYRTVETLVLANKLGDIQFLDECVKDAAHSISVYREVLKDKSDLDKSFKNFVREKSICTDSINFNYLAETLGGKTPSLKAVLKFMNEFGITMFGEVDG